MAITSVDYIAELVPVREHMHFYMVSSGKHAVCMTLMKLMLLQGTHKER